MERIYDTPRTRRRPKRNIFTVFFFLIILTVVIFLVFNFFKSSPFNSSPLKERTVLSSSAPTNNDPNISKPLEQVVKNALIDTRGSYGIVIKNLKTGEYYALQENIKYDTSSLYKLWVMAVVYGQMKEGKLKDSDILSQNIDVLNKKFNISSESAELKEGNITLSIHDALEQMITISDNYAALLLTEKVGQLSLATFLKDNGFTQSAVSSNGSSPTTTPRDISLFFEKLYKNQLVDTNYSQRMLLLLKRQKLNNKIPKYLPDNTIVAHKTGELDSFTHDAGIIYGNRNDYIVVVLSKSENTDLATGRIALVSESIYRYFELK
ncbi:MAG: class A beta-lactamase-related serine hydrolase [Patescibacteria group bacterium]|nr:class A beta-lactamase-related serine hydrolase [Patescibacteria group bacterium]